MLVHTTVREQHSNPNTPHQDTDGESSAFWGVSKQMTPASKPNAPETLTLHHPDGRSHLGLAARDGGGGDDVSNLGGRLLGLTDHDGQLDRCRTTLEEDVLFAHKAKLLIVGIVGKGARLEVDRPLLSIGLGGQMFVSLISCISQRAHRLMEIGNIPCRSWSGLACEHNRGLGRGV